MKTKLNEQRWRIPCTPFTYKVMGQALPELWLIRWLKLILAPCTLVITLRRGKNRAAKAALPLGLYHRMPPILNRLTLYEELGNIDIDANMVFMYIRRLPGLIG